MKKIPFTLQPFLWSKSVKKLDRDRDNIYVIHQILSYGDIKELRLLFQLYDRKEIRKVFVNFPKKIYQPSVFLFIKKYILGLTNIQLKEKDYVKTLF